MNPERYGRIRELFLEAGRRGPEERVAFLERECADDPELAREVEELLASDREAESFLERAALGTAFALREPDATGGAAGVAATSSATVRLPEVIGRYRILDILGEGGMGTVYRAEQENPRRCVALKIVKPGLATQRRLVRFEHEAQILGRLQHPGIAQIFEAGAADAGFGPQPFFAMELVLGLAISDYVAKHGLDTRHRLELFVKVCDAVHHAHQKGVIHRDLKPANILVDAGGQPKVLDFGVARTTDADVQTSTQQGEVRQILGTLPYMSPEQIGGDPDEIDIRSDVFALGVIGYELVSGRLPYDLEAMTISEAARVIVEAEPTALGRLDRAWRGDVETIFAKALEKERGRRYASAAQLAQDIEHYLRDEPIVARPPSTAYQLRKFARRHKAVVIGLCATVIALALGLIGTGISTVRARAAENDVLKALEFLENTFTTSVADVGPEAKVADVLDRAEKDIATTFAQKPLLEARVRSTFGGGYLRLGLYPRAREQLARALEIERTLLGEEAPETVESLANWALLLRVEGDLTTSEQIFRRVLDLEQKRWGENDVRTMRATGNLEQVLCDLRRWGEAKVLAQRALEMARRMLGPEAEDTLTATTDLVGVLILTGEFEEAEPLARGELAVTQKKFGEENSRTLVSLNNLALVLQKRGQPAEAGQIYSRALAASRRVLGPDNPETLVTASNMASLLFDEKKLAEAEMLMRETLEIARRVLPPASGSLMEKMSNLALCLRDENKFDESQSLYEEVLEIERRTLGEEAPTSLETKRDLERVLERRAKLNPGQMQSEKPSSR